MDKWISVEDRLPDDYGPTEFIVSRTWRNGIRSVGTRTWSFNRFLGDPLNDITHWMPLPDPPGTGKADEDE